MEHPWAAWATVAIFYLSFAGFIAARAGMSLQEYLIAILIPPALLAVGIPIATWIAIGKFQFGL